MPADGRVSAWLQAWGRVEAANKMLRDDVRGDLMLTPEYRNRHGDLMAQADILARLASAPDDVGLGAGEGLQQEYVREQEARKKMEKLLDGR